MRVSVLVAALVLIAGPALAGGPCRNTVEWHHDPICMGPHASIYAAPAPLIGAGAPALLAVGGLLAARLVRRRKA